MKLSQVEINWAWKNYEMLKSHDDAYNILYTTKSGIGRIVVDTIYYERNIKKFTKLLADCDIIKFEVIKKPDIDENGRRFS